MTRWRPRAGTPGATATPRSRSRGSSSWGCCGARQPGATWRSRRGAWVTSAGMRRVPRVLAIAGSDSGGGAGIQADLKAFAAAGVHGMTAITAITVQNTVAVSAVETVAPAIITAQIRVVAEDLGVDAVKIGMLGDIATIEA